VHKYTYVKTSSIRFQENFNFLFIKNCYDIMPLSSVWNCCGAKQVGCYRHWSAVHSVKVTYLLSIYSIKVVGLHICIYPPTHFDKSRLLRFTKPSSLYSCAILHALFHITFHEVSINLPDHKITLFVPLYYDCYLKSDQMSHLLLRIATNILKNFIQKVMNTVHFYKNFSFT
jgi:hypothetical protein